MSPKVLVILYQGFQLSHIDVLDYLKPSPDEVAAVRIGDTANMLNLPEKLQGITLFSVAGALQEKFDLVVIPGSSDSTEPSDALDANDLRSLQELLNLATWTATLGSGTLLMVKSGFCDNDESTARGFLMASPASTTAETMSEKWPSAKWVDIKTVKTAGIWTSRGGSTEDIHSLGVLLNHSMSNPRDLSHYYPWSLFNHPQRGYSSPSNNSSSTSERIPLPAHGICAEIQSCKIEEDAVHNSSTFALILAMETHVEACNAIMTTLFSLFPNCGGHINPYVLNGLEFYWDASGMRPEEVPWERPDLDAVGASVQGSQWNELSEEEELNILQLVEVQVDVGGYEFRPYGVELAAALAYKHGREELAKTLMDALARDLRDSDHLVRWITVAKWRPLSRPILAGAIAQHTGRTPEIAQQEAEQVSQTLRSWPADNERYKTERNNRAQELRALSYPQLAERLNSSLKRAGEETLLKLPSATQAEILATEERLGIQLPEDYKSFMLVSNGLDYIQTVQRPGLRPISDLKWEDAEEMGLGELPMELGEKLDPDEEEQMPRFGRLIVISDEDSEELLWLVEPKQMGDAREVLRRERGQTGTPGAAAAGEDATGKWGVVYWEHWDTDVHWYNSFREYLQSLFEVEALPESDLR